MAYRPIPESVGGLEKHVLRRWDEEETFAQSLSWRAEAEDFVFYEGPPTANGRPGVHHILARTIKDVIARYRTMAGYHVPRKAGWDTHGLPVELEAERQLGISGKPLPLGIARYERAVPQPGREHGRRIEALRRRLAERPGLALAGAYMGGVSVSESFSSGLRAAGDVGSEV